MIKKLNLPVTLIAMALLFPWPQLLHAMDIKNEAEESLVHRVRAITVNEKNAYKMLLFQEAQVQTATDKKFPTLPKDIQSVIWGIFYELTKNPILEGSLIYTKQFDRQQFTFKIKDLVKEETLDFSGPDFEGISKSLVITTDPTRFFLTKGENTDKVVTLIAPWSLIKEKIGSTTASFLPIMDSWDANIAPIGIFWRSGNWEKPQWYDYLTNIKIDEINSKNLGELWGITRTTLLRSHYLYTTIHLHQFRVLF